ncbi:MAG: nfdA 5, partial [Nocardioidaceae bacterium]|nr:nfdA 5 [Nocardioidaceae bacterium]
MRADLLLRNATVVTNDGPDATAVAILGDRIVALEEVDAHEVVDLDGAVVVPGFHDAHNHMAWYGLSLAEVDLAVDDVDVLLTRLAERHASLPANAWLVGSGYDENRTGRHPDVTDLDRVAPGRRVWLKHKSGHMCVVSSPLHAELGIGPGTAAPPAGRIVTDPA